jgi:hypothetical protein
VSTLISDKQGSISLSPCKSLSQEIRGETLIPCPRSLLKPIKPFSACTHDGDDEDLEIFLAVLHKPFLEEHRLEMHSLHPFGTT